MSVQIIQFSTEAERVPDVEEAIKNLLAAAEESAPTGLEYAAWRAGDAAEFLLSMRIADGHANPLLEIREAPEFRVGVAEWAGAPVLPQTVTVLGRYSRA